MKLDGLPPETWGLKPIESHVHPSPDVRQNVMFIPGRPGLWDFGSQLEARRFERPFAIVERDPLERQRKLREFTAFLFDSYGRPREIKLTFDYEPDKYYSVKFAGQITPDRYFNLATFTLPLVAHDPYAYADMNAYDSDQTPVYGEVGEDEYYENTQSFQWLYSNHYSGVHNHSKMNTDLILTIEGTVTNPSITHFETNQKITLPSIVNKKLEIDSSNFTVKVDGVSNLANTNGNFFRMVSGDNRFLFEGESPNATVTYKWKHKFI